MRKVAVWPQCWRNEPVSKALHEAGVELVEANEATGIIWVEPTDATELELLLGSNPNIDWVQLPWAGIEPFKHLVADGRTWTCGKGIYARPVAEMALAMILTALRGLKFFGAADRWEEARGKELADARITIVGGGGITEWLLRFLAPFSPDVTVVRNRDLPIAGAKRVVTTDALTEAITGVDAVVLALALTPETSGLIGKPEFEAMGEDAWLVNVARGGHVDTDALVHALTNEVIAGACLDVTDPEPLPDGHALWSLPNCLITPHVGNTPEMGIRLLSERAVDNAKRYLAHQELLGPVYPELGY